jgi:FHA domain-containing protein
MNLVLRGLTLNDNPLSQPLIGRFDERGGSVGRSENATMTLADPERLISRVQANISYGANIYWLEDVGSANPVVHNGLPLGPGVKVPLKANDDLRIGGYRLAVEYEQADTSATVVRRGPPVARPAEPSPATPTPVRAGANPFADLLRDGASSASADDSGVDPFASLMKAASKPQQGQAPGARGAGPAGPGTRGVPMPGDVFDPFAPLDAEAKRPPKEPPAERQPREAAGLAGPPDAGPAGRARPPTKGGGAEPPVGDPMVLFDDRGDASPRPAAKPAPAHLARDFDAALKAAGEAPAARPKSSARKVAAGAGASASTPRRAAAPAAPVASGEPAGPSTYSADEIWQGFLDGAGVNVALPRGVTPEMMRTIGVMLRMSVEGMLQLIAVRAAAKNELHAPVTVIQVRENNPLKFSPDATVALMQLLQPPGRGFLPGPEAIRDAMVDLQSHQIGTMAGMRAALAGVLERFQPELLEGRLTGQSMLDALLPINRKAKLWELFLQHYRVIRSDAEEDFHALFGKAFVEAYNAQVERLSQQDEDGSVPPV